MTYIFEKKPLKASVEIVHTDKDGKIISVEKEEMPLKEEK